MDYQLYSGMFSCCYSRSAATAPRIVNSFSNPCRPTSYDSNHAHLARIAVYKLRKVNTEYRVRQSKHYRHTFLGIFFIIVTFLGSSGMTIASDAEYRLVTGRKLGWSMQVPIAWIGGNYQEITMALNKTQNEALLKILPILREQAKQNDVVLFYISLKNLSLYPVMKINPMFNPIKIDQIDDEEFMRLALAAEKKEQPGAVATFVRFDKNLMTAGYPAARIVIRIELPTGQTRFRVVHIVTRPTETLMFKFYVGNDGYGEVIIQFDEMLRSLRYE